MKNRFRYLLAFTLVSFFSIAQADRIIFTAPKVYPEGVAYSGKTNSFFVSSVKTGTIGTVDQKGIYTEFYKDTSLKSSFGMKVDEKNNLLWVCISDPNYSAYSDSTTFKKMARIISLDLTTKKKVSDIDLAKLKPGKHFANDLIGDGKGNLYATDSFSPVIYKIDKAGKASVFVSSELFTSVSVGLNGIVYHPSGYLLVAHNTNGAILKCPLEIPNNYQK